MRKVTIKDIAALLNTSPHTVSKALNNKPGVSQEFREKIKQTAHELNYVPNIFGKGLSGKPSKTIGVIITDNTNPMYSLILKGLEEKVAEANYTIILCNSNDDVRTEEKLIYLLLEKQVDGLILRPVDDPDTQRNIELLQRFDMPYIAINRVIPHQEECCIHPNNFRAAYLGGQYLLQKGHSRIIHLTRKHSIIAVEDRIAALKKVFSEYNLTFPDENVYRRCEGNVENAYAEMLKILRERQDFTAVFAYNDIMAFGVMKAVHECRLRIPNDVAIMGVDNLMFAEICLVPLTTVNHHLSAVGAIAAEVLLNKIQHRPDAPHPSVPEPYIVERQSV
jgi:LacI family transcriptional regulator